MWLAGIPVVGGTLTVVELLGFAVPEAAPFVAIPYGALFLATSLRMTFMPCPRCARPFFSRPSLANSLTSRCMNCGLPSGDEAFKLGPVVSKILAAVLALFGLALVSATFVFLYHLAVGSRSLPAVLAGLTFLALAAYCFYLAFRVARSRS